MAKPDPLGPDWLWAMIRNHIERFPRGDWPGNGKASPFWQGWARAFARAGVTQGEAEAASIALMAEPPEYLDHHLGRLLKIIEGLRERAEREQATGRFAQAPRHRESNHEAGALLGQAMAASGPERAALMAELERRAKLEELGLSTEPVQQKATRLKGIPA